MRLGARLVFCLALLAPVVGARAAESTSLEAPSPPRFAEADRAFRERGDPERARTSVEIYERLLSEREDDVEAAWRLSMSLYYVGIRVAPTKEEKERIFARGRDVAKQGLALEPDCAPCHLFAGINMALYGESVGVIRMLFSLGEIRGHLRSAYDLEPAFAYAAAPRALAMIDEALPRLLGGSKSRAEDYYKEAISLDPSEPLNYLYYAQFLSKRRDDHVGALEVARRGLGVERPGPHRVESLDAIVDLERLVPEYERRIAEPPKPRRRLGPGGRRRQR